MRGRTCDHAAAPIGARRGPRRRGGFSYVEVLVATVVLAVALVPALDALRTGVLGASVHASEAAAWARVQARMEEVLAKPFSTLQARAAAASGPAIPDAVLSDPPPTPDRVRVYVAFYDGDDADGDGDPFTGGDSGLVWVRVATDGSPHALETLTSGD